VSSLFASYTLTPSAIFDVTGMSFPPANPPAVEMRNVSLQASVCAPTIYFAYPFSESSLLN